MLSAPARSAGPPVKFISSSRTQTRPAFSPDGHRLVFESTRSGTQEVWISDVDGSNAVALTAFGRPYTGTARWSPDGRSVAFDSHTDRGSSIYVVGAAGGAASARRHRSCESSEPAWSKDGRWFYFTGDNPRSHADIQGPVEGGEATQLTTQGGHAPRAPSIDGRIYYTRDQEDLVRLPRGRR